MSESLELIKNKKAEKLDVINSFSNYLNEKFDCFNNKVNMFDKLKTNDGNDPNKKIKKERNTGIDLVRLIGMILIIFNHAMFYGGAIAKYMEHRQKLFRIYTFIFWHNDAYALISGIVGYKATKYSNLIYLWLIVLFYSTGIFYYFVQYKKYQLNDMKYRYSLDDRKFTYFFPVIFNKYWYFTSYFGMYIYLPAINRGIEYLTKSEFKILILSIFSIFVLWHNYMNQKSDVFKFNKGFSPIWLLSLYLIGAYIGKYNIVHKGIKKYIYCVIYLSIFLTICIYYNKMFEMDKSDIYKINNSFKRIILLKIKENIGDNYNSITKTIQSVCITLFFLQMNYNKYISKITAFISPLVFSLYLIHLHPIVQIKILSFLFVNEPRIISFSELIILLIYKTVIIFGICIFIDYMRHLLFTFLRIRKICILLEKLIFKIFG